MRKKMRSLKSMTAAATCLIALAFLIMPAFSATIGPAPDDHQGPGRVFRAGASAVDITPEKLPVIVNGGFLESRSDKVHDRLHARGLVLDDGITRVAIVVVDSCLIPDELLDEAKRLAHEATGIPTDRMLISATHTHSAPSVVGALGSDADPEYSRFLPSRIAGAIELAQKNLSPARIGFAVAINEKDTNCRRWILRPDRIRTDPFGGQTVRAMMHPGYLNPDFLGPAGPTDPGLSVLSVQSPEGRPIALFANYSMHYFGSPALSADYYGRFAQKIKQLVGSEKTDPPFVGILSQGTSGDLHWMDYSQPAKSLSIDDYAESVARVAFVAYETIRYRDWVPLQMRERKLTLASRLPNAERLAWATDIVKGMGGRKPQTQPEVYAREQIFLVERPTRELKLQALRIGDLGIAAIPCEVFGITGLKIKAQSPLIPTFVMELANGYHGYIPPPEQHKLGGYTTWEARSAGLETAAEPKIVEAVLGLLEDVSGVARRPVVDEHVPYSTAVLASKPVAYWRMNEFSGPRALDASGKEVHGEYEDGVAFYLEGPTLSNRSGEGQRNRSPHFAGGRMKALAQNLGGTYSVELWLYNTLPSDARLVTGYFFSRGVDGAPGAPGDHLCIGGTHQAAGKLTFFNGNALDQALLGTTEIPAKTWNHVVMVRENRKVTVYLNGNTQPEISGEADISIASSVQQIVIGGRNDGFANFEGKLDEVALYDRALSAEEIRSHYQAAGPPAE